MPFFLVLLFIEYCISSLTKIVHKDNTSKELIKVMAGQQITYTVSKQHFSFFFSFFFLFNKDRVARGVRLINSKDTQIESTYTVDLN